MSKNENEMSLADYLARQDNAAYPQSGKQFKRGNRAKGKIEQPSELSAAEFQKQNQKKLDLEHEMQCEIVVDFRRDFPQYAGLMYAIPNGAKLQYFKDEETGKYTSPQRIYLTKEGMLKGAVDLCLPVARGGWHGFYMENKILPNQPTDEQRAFMELLTKEGYLCVVCYTREQGREFFHNYLNLPPYGTQSES